MLDTDDLKFNDIVSLYPEEIMFYDGVPNRIDEDYIVDYLLRIHKYNSNKCFYIYNFLWRDYQYIVDKEVVYLSKDLIQWSIDVTLVRKENG